MCNLTKFTKNDSFYELVDIECPICGKCTIKGIVNKKLQSSQANRKLSAWIREQNESQKIPQLLSDDIESILLSIPDYNPSEKQLKLLKNIERKSNYPGDLVEINRDNDFPLAWASNDNELLYYLHALRNRGFIELDLHDSAIITADGWDYLDQYGSDMEEKMQVFIAMSFSGDMS